MRTILALLLSSYVFGQAPVAFEVASVKLNHSEIAGSLSGRGGSMRVSGAEIFMENVSLWKCIAIAYGVGKDNDYAISGLVNCRKSVGRHGRFDLPLGFYGVTGGTRVGATVPETPRGDYRG